MQVGWNDRMQEEVNTQRIFRQVRTALSVTPYSYVNAINALRMPPEDLLCYKNICLNLEFHAPCSSRLVDVFRASVVCRT